MIILKHVEHEIRDGNELSSLLAHLDETTAKVPGVAISGIWFPRGKREFVLVMDCTSEDKYLEWREICPPPPGAGDWYEVLLTKEERFGR
jgi:hypothetical protein